MKKILFFIESLAGGGAEKVLSDIVANLDNNKYDITVCTVTDEGIYQEKVRNSCKYKSFLKTIDYRAGGIKKIIYWIKMKLIYGLPSKFVYKCFIHEKYDIEVAFVEGFATKLVSSSSNNESKKMAWVHIDVNKNPYADKYYKNLLQQRSTYEKMDKIICVSRSVKEAFEYKFSLEENIYVQYNPVDSDEIKKRAVDTIELKVNPFLQLGTIGRLEQQKGYIRLVDYLGKLKEKGYKFALWIIGDGAQRKEIERCIEKYHLEDVVKLIGFQKNPYKYMNKCDVFVCSSYAEGFSTAATESLILGKPVFTTECAGMKELFGDFVCGEIVPNNDKELYILLEQLVSGTIKPESYHADVQKRADDFKIEKRIREIEELLDS